MKRFKGRNAYLTALVTMLALSLLIAGCAEQEQTAPEGSGAPTPADSKTEQGETVEIKTVFTLDDKGFPVKESIDNLFDEMDYQRATIAYLWAMPQMTFQGQYNLGKHYGVKDQMDFLIQYDDPSVVGMLTPNTVVKYVVNVPDLTKTGPLLLEMPGGQLVGLMMDFQMHWVADLGLVSKAGPNPEKILFLGPDD